MTKKTETCASPAPGSPDAALAERLFEEPPEEPLAGKPFINFIPPGALSAIGRLIDDPELNWPWPYDDGELKTVLVQLPQDSHDASGLQVVYAARVYLAKLWAQRRGPKSKPNPIEELRNLKKAADALLLAVKALSIEAHGMLDNKQRLHVPDAIRWTPKTRGRPSAINGKRNLMTARAADFSKSLRACANRAAIPEGSMDGHSRAATHGLQASTKALLTKRMAQND